MGNRPTQGFSGTIYIWHLRRTEPGAHRETGSEALRNTETKALRHIIISTRNPQTTNSAQDPHSHSYKASVPCENCQKQLKTISITQRKAEGSQSHSKNQKVLKEDQNIDCFDSTIENMLTSKKCTDNMSQEDLSQQQPSPSNGGLEGDSYQHTWSWW